MGSSVAAMDNLTDSAGGAEDLPATIQSRRQAAALIDPDTAWYRIGKRAMDLVGGLALLLATLPVTAVAAALIKLSSKGPILFRQERIGRGGRPFVMYKLRTMYQGAEDARPVMERLNEKSKPIFKIRHDPRVTPVGRFLRRSSIDELPQLINVLRGEMSLVGPRPLWVKEADEETGLALLRTAVKPGLTCLWQISGRSELDYRTWVQLDVQYVLHRGLLLDAMILLQTIPVVLSEHGAY